MAANPSSTATARKITTRSIGSMSAAYISDPLENLSRARAPQLKKLERPPSGPVESSAVAGVWLAPLNLADVGGCRPGRAPTRPGRCLGLSASPPRHPAGRSHSPWTERGGLSPR